MKRVDQDVAGRPRERVARRDVAGVSFGKRSALSDADVASYRHALDDPMATVAEDAVLFEDFVEFLAGDDDLDSGPAPAPDPEFRDRLRKRLWRRYVLTHLRKRGERH